MLVTEAKLIAESGYTKNQIKHRRLNCWERGVHYWSDPQNTTVYDLGVISKWQKSEQPGSATGAESAKSGGWKERGDATKRSRSNTPQLV